MCRGQGGGYNVVLLINKSIYWRFDNVVAFHVFSSKGLALWILPSRCTRGSLPILIKCHTEAMLRGFEK